MSTYGGLPKPGSTYFRSGNLAESTVAESHFNPLMPTVQLHSNVLLYSNTVIGTQAVDGWTVTFGTAKTGLRGAGARLVPSSLYQM